MIHLALYFNILDTPMVILFQPPLDHLAFINLF